jgi:hypothetical protein
MPNSTCSSGQSSARASMTVVVLAVAIAVVSCATAFAATYDYCAGCTIGAYSVRDSNVSKSSSLSYVHRLSGPSAGSMTITAAAYIAGGSFVCSNTNFVLEITCNPAGNFVRGRAQNNGAGNYSFNAHLNY